MDRLSLDRLKRGDESADPDPVVAGINEQRGDRLVFAELDVLDGSADHNRLARLGVSSLDSCIKIPAEVADILDRSADRGVSPRKRPLGRRRRQRFGGRPQDG